MQATAPRAGRFVILCRCAMLSPEGGDLVLTLRGIRAPGTGWPGRIALGTWRHRGGKGFAAVYRGQPAVMVRLRDSEFAWLLVSSDDAENVAARLRAAR